MRVAFSGRRLKDPVWSPWARHVRDALTRTRGRVTVDFLPVCTYGQETE